MKDVQSQFDERNISLNEVGVKNLAYPVELRNDRGDWISTRAVFTCAVGLPAEQKGTHMSRFVELISENNRLELSKLRNLLQDMQKKLDACSSFLKIQFSYFVRKTSPVTGRESLMEVEVEIRAALIEDDFTMEVTVRTPVTTLCPCSKEISDYSAHNQRAIVSITANTKKFFPFETFVKLSEESASSPLYTLLKRPDEKYVTEWAYDHPRFVEDVAREVKQRVDDLSGIRSYVIEVESFESIHNHSAYAKIISTED